jgi:hypothetical protein
MTSREIIIGNLERTGPPRIGLDFKDYGISDFVGSGLDLDRIWKPRRWVEGRMEYYDDVWGNVWHRFVHMSKGGEVCDPALKDWADLESYQLPELDRPDLYEKASAVFAAHPDTYKTGSVPGFPFAICRYLRKMEVYFQDLVLEREHIDALHERVTSLLERVIRRHAEAGADGIFFCEDWGIQDRLLIHPDMWREIFKPLFRRLCTAAHDAGLHVLMHSCGYNWDILDDLAEVGVNAFQFDQPSLYGLERLAEKLRALGVCLFSPVDIQKILPTGDKELIESTARKMIDLFARPDGGLIAKKYGDLPGIGVEETWDRWALAVFESEGALQASVSAES